MQVKVVEKNESGNPVNESMVNVTITETTTVADVKSQINETIAPGFTELSFTMDGDLFQDQDLIGSHQAIKYCVRY